MLRLTVILSIVCALAVAPAGLGGPAVAHTLTPPPLPWLTCMPVGGGTICEGTRSISYGPEDSGFRCGAVPRAFVILDTATRYVRVKWTYDAQGLLVQRLIHFRYVSARVTNSLTGAELPYTQTQLRTDDLAVPGDLGSATITYAGEIIFGSPGGAPVTVGPGRSSWTQLGRSRSWKARRVLPTCTPAMFRSCARRSAELTPISRGPKLARNLQRADEPGRPRTR